VRGPTSSPGNAARRPAGRLERLSEEHLCQLGVELVGHRLILMRAIRRLHGKAVTRKRFEVLWEAKAELYSGGCQDWAYKQMWLVPCCDHPDHYKLTMSSLVVTERDHSKFQGLCNKAKITRHIDLSNVVGVSSYSPYSCANCGCDADEIFIELNQELGLQRVRPLLVMSGEGAAICQKFQAAIEETQALAAEQKQQGHIGGAIMKRF